MSVAFRRESDEEHKEPRFELPIPSGPNLVTAAGLAQAEAKVAELKEMVAGETDEGRLAELQRTLRYWNTRNGLDSVGFPITEELQENGRPVQYFQRGRLEYRQEAAGTRDEVVAGAVGDEVLRQRGWLD